MAAYRLKILHGPAHAAETIEFEADDASSALIVANREAGDNSAELWSGERRLCVLQRQSTSTGEFWKIGC